MHVLFVELKGIGTYSITLLCIKNTGIETLEIACYKVKLQKVGAVIMEQSSKKPVSLM